MPNAFVNYKGNQGLMANPDAKHYWDHDIFTYITSLPDPEKNKDTASFKSQSLKKGDTAFYANGFICIGRYRHADKYPVRRLGPDDKVFSATLSKYFQKIILRILQNPF